MVLRLEAIKFNHDTSRATADAINIRRNETEFLNVPEWRRGLSVYPEDSPAAYALCETRGNTLTIQANFSCDEPCPEGLKIRALDALVHPGPATDTHPAAFAEQTPHPALHSPVGNVLGEVEAKHVMFCEGETGFQTFELKNVRIWDAGVGAQDIIWCWQYSLGTTGGWTDLVDTTHRIYTVLKVPKCPWQQEDHAPRNTQLPWAEVLDRACHWAAGAHNTDVVAALITQRVQALGQGVVCYQSSSHYTDEDSFACTSFLRLLRGGKCSSKKVNCDDCAAIVSTFANALGCDLSQSLIKVTGESTFNLKPHFRIGIQTRLLDRRFRYHQVASEGSCREIDEVFDACILVDADGDPATPEVILPSNLRFGNAVGDGYRFRLVTPDDEPFCVPQEGGCKRRRLGAANRLSATPVDRLTVLKEHSDFFSRALYDEAVGGILVSDFFIADHLLPGWRLVRLQEYRVGMEHTASESYWETERHGDDAVLRVDVFKCPGRDEAREGVLALLTRFQEPDMTPMETPVLGHLAFADPALTTVLFATANLIFFLRNASSDSVPLMNIAHTLNNIVINSTLAVRFMPDPRGL